MEWKYRNIALEQLDEKIVDTKNLHNLSRPSKGWIKSIREAFGMTMTQLGKRANGIPQPNISRLEKQEAAGSTTIETMENVARALNCRFVYALIPETSYRDIIMQQARKVAKTKISYISHSMHLEDQKLSDLEIEKQIEELAIELLQKKPKIIWENSENR